MENIVPAREKINKFLFDHGFKKILTSVLQHWLSDMITGLAMKGNLGRTTDFAELNQVAALRMDIFFPPGNGMRNRFPASIGRYLRPRPT